MRDDGSVAASPTAIGRAPKQRRSKPWPISVMMWHYHSQYQLHYQWQHQCHYQCQLQRIDWRSADARPSWRAAATIVAARAARARALSTTTTTTTTTTTSTTR